MAASVSLLVKVKIKISTVNGIAALIIDKMRRNVKFCTFIKNPLHCAIPALTAV
jgi:hypothetical protein